MRTRNGFSLIEMLLVLAILGIIAGIAIPSFLGQRERARLIGDAKTNAQILAMQMESKRMDLGKYGSGGPYSWTKASPTNSFLPTFSPKGQSQMDYKLTLLNSGMAFRVSVTDPSRSNKLMFSTNQNGSVLYQAK